MTDLLTRLRSKTGIGPDGCPSDDLSRYVPALLLEAADEIERLRERLQQADTIMSFYAIAIIKNNGWVSIAQSLLEDQGQKARDYLNSLKDGL